LNTTDSTIPEVFRRTLNELRLSDPAMLLESAFFGTALFGLVLFIFGIGSFFVEAFGLKRRLTKRGFVAR
jgi:hypothetical protein